MPKLPIVSGVDIIRLLAKIEYEIDHQTGSHFILRCKEPHHIGGLLYQITKNLLKGH